MTNEEMVEKMMVSVNKIETSVAVLLSETKDNKEDVKSIKKDLYAPKEGLFNKLSSLITKVNLQWGLLIILVSAMIYKIAKS